MPTQAVPLQKKTTDSQICITTTKEGSMTPYAIVHPDKRAFEKVVEQAQKLQQAQKRGHGQGFG